MTKHIEFLSTTENLSPRASEICFSIHSDSKITLDGNTYYFDREGTVQKIARASGSSDTEKNIVFCLENLKDIEVDGRGSYLCFRDTLTPFMLRNCKNITLKNFTIDFSFSRYSEGTVTESDESGFTLFFNSKIFSIRADEEGHLLFDGKNKTYGTHEGPLLFSNKYFGRSPWDYIFAGNNTHSKEGLPVGYIETDACLIDKSHIRFNYRKNSRRLVFPIGDILIFNYEPRENINIFLDSCENIRLENITMHRSGGMGIVSHICSNLEMDRVIIEPHKDRGESRSTTADGMYFVQCYGKIHIHNCRLIDTLDDALNIHGIYTLVDEICAKNQIVAKIGFKDHKGISPFKTGCEIFFTDAKTMDEYAGATVTDAKVLDEERTLLTLDENVAVKAGDYIESSLSGEFIFENNVVEGCPHVRISDPGKKIIKNNIFKKIKALVIFDLYKYWFESGPVNGMLIEGNTFDNCPYTTDNYTVLLECERGRNTKVRHKNVCIKNNSFIKKGSGFINAAYVKGLKISGNSYSEPSDAVNLVGCEDVEIS